MEIAGKKCFVLMPFAEKLREIYTEVYKPVCVANGLEPWRVDEIARPGSITKDIIEGILDADIIIADLTDRNANVFYELGIAHTTGNKTIMTAQLPSDVPFDIASYRVIFYEHTLNGCKTLHTKLDLAIKELLAALNRTNNPFQEVAANRGGFRVKGKTPLVKAVDLRSMGKALRDYLTENKIFYLDDLKRINLEEVYQRQGFGSAALGQLCTILLEYELYDDMEAFHRFLVEKRVETENNSVARSMAFNRYAAEFKLLRRRQIATENASE